MRIESIHTYLQENGFLEDMNALQIVESQIDVQEDGTNRYPTIEGVHSVKQIKKVETVSNNLSSDEAKNAPFESLYYCKDTFMAAKLAADACLSAVCQVLDEDCPEQRGYCIVRPPGHHAHAERYHGFCFFNNVALAATLAANQGKKVLIFDWDIHQGDGTQTIFYDSDRVMLMSLHRCDDLNFFPGRKDSLPQYTGNDGGKGYNVNVAWHTRRHNGKHGSMRLGSNEYRHACDEVLLPIAKEFNPDLILVSCGFDSAIHDQLGGAHLAPLGYYYMTQELLKICPQMIVILEGGYNTDYLGQHASGVVKALLDVPPNEYGEPTQADKDAGFTTIDDIKSDEAQDWAKANVAETKSCHAKFWKLGDGDISKTAQDAADSLKPIVEDDEEEKENLD